MNTYLPRIGRTIGELPKGYCLYARCLTCPERPYAPLDVHRLIARFTQRMTYDGLEARLYCRRCRQCHGRLIFVFAPGSR